MGILDLNNIKEALQIAGKIEFYPQILEMQEKLLDQQKKISDLETENKSLKEKLEIQESLVFENNAYWIDGNDKKDGPYCSCCWDDHKKTIRMQPCGNPAFYSCPRCTNKNVKIYPERDITSQQFHNNDQNFFNSAV